MGDKWDLGIADVCRSCHLTLEARESRQSSAYWSFGRSESFVYFFDYNNPKPSNYKAWEVQGSEEELRNKKYIVGRGTDGYVLIA